MDLSKIYFDSNGKKGNILQIVALEPEWAANRIQEGEKAIARITDLEAQLAAAQERERQLNDELYYACELAIAYAHSEKDKEWAAKRIEELMPPEQESDHDN